MKAIKQSLIPKNTILQMLFWGGIWLLIPLALIRSEGEQVLIWRGVLTFFGVMLMVYLNLELLIPLFFFKKKYGLYILFGLVAIIIISTLFDWAYNLWIEPLRSAQNELNKFIPPPNGPMKYVARAMPFFTATIGSSLFKITAFANQQEKEAVRLRNEKLEAEMKFLKSQINPHFLFNSLNNIYTLTVIKSETAPEYLLKLSNMLRYVLYECNAEKVPLQREVEYIRNFVELSKLRDSRGMNIKTALPKANINPMVAPMLFIPFIENALKHSKIEDLKNGWIDINLQANEQAIHFEVKNSIPVNGVTKDKAGGIGLQNVERRLELMYPGKHNMQLLRTDDHFEAFLNIELK